MLSLGIWVPRLVSRGEVKKHLFLLPPGLAPFHSFLETNRRDSGLCLFRALVWGPFVRGRPIPLGVGTMPVMRLELVNGTPVIIIFLGEDLTPLARDPFRWTTWFYNFMGAHSFLVSKKNCASSWGARGGPDSYGLCPHRA